MEIEKRIIENKDGHVKSSFNYFNFEMTLESIVFSSKHFVDESKSDKKEPSEKQAAWMDPDDFLLIPNPELKKAPSSAEHPPKQVISTVLRQQFNQAMGHIDTSWTKATQSVAPTVDASDIFSETQSQIPSESLAINRVADLFKTSSKDKSKGPSILATAFHPSEDFASVLDSKGCLHIVAVNPKKCNVQHRIPFDKKPPRYCLCYTANGEHIIIAGKEGNYITVDCQTQQIIHFKVQGCQQDIKHVYCSPDNSLLLMLCGNSVHFINAANKTLLRTVPTSDELKCGAFSDDSQYFIACGKNGYGLVFNCETHFPENRFQEPEMQYIHDISISRDRVAIGTEAGVLHIFDFNHIRTEQFPKPLFTKMNLVTKVDTVRFNPTGELVVFASSGKKDSLRVLHLASKNVYSNWPTQNTPLSYVRDVAFDHTSKYLAIANDKGLVTLWELPFYEAKQ